jgi:hypothetical protein
VIHLRNWFGLMAKTELQEWLGGRFEPHRFSLTQANARLARAMR